MTWTFLYLFSVSFLCSYFMSTSHRLIKKNHMLPVVVCGDFLWSISRQRFLNRLTVFTIHFILYRILFVAICKISPFLFFQTPSRIHLTRRPDMLWLIVIVKSLSLPLTGVWWVFCVSSVDDVIELYSSCRMLEMSLILKGNCIVFVVCVSRYSVFLSVRNTLLWWSCCADRYFVQFDSWW